ncbi:bifunctional hydroxymethylpyrimidine kinase/phosphomethylpyrimidine kinase [Desulfotalea psychrophila]|uniref:hydroxymethylpyrimidine kinase n=1 Tax=Desulfotalea psychrophila (strain LSv54 / DSM 12343) TaxID=177439 RepID=Q6APS9_DESPS|nr:bifunctional hydroxymethylpyrimidine kinase/phosphomethylpyrimidine kinase [Desulfotalea psychrophila]CAG35645.1 probable phosphomethylpyrimidine kinase (ThiD) [Desulfotalea psychrophila LSv54]
MKEYKRVLTIAGSDSGGGAGIQADLKTFSACGCFGTSAITAITAQNTLGVRAIHSVPVEILQAQVLAVIEDIGVDAIKIGMLHSAELIAAVAVVLREADVENIVLDPVMVATSGDPLIEESAVDAMKKLLFPLVKVITPNIPEAEILLGQKIEGEDLAQVAQALAEEFSVSVLAKAGHQQGDLFVDVLYSSVTEKITRFPTTRVDTQNTHGTGCSLSSAIASFLARGEDLETAIASASQYLHGALVAGAEYKIGAGHGPVHHFYRFW